MSVSIQALQKMQKEELKKRAIKFNNIMFAMAYLASEKAANATLTFNKETLEFTFQFPKEFDDGELMLNKGAPVMNDPVIFTQLDFEKAVQEKRKEHNRLVDNCNLILELLGGEDLFRDRLESIYQDEAPFLVPLARAPEKVLVIGSQDQEDNKTSK